MNNSVDAPPKQTLAWIKASRSRAGGACVELAPDSGMVALRDSKDPSGPILRFTSAEMADLLACAKNGELDHLI